MKTYLSLFIHICLVVVLVIVMFTSCSHYNESFPSDDVAIETKNSTSIDELKTYDENNCSDEESLSSTTEESQSLGENEEKRISNSIVLIDYGREAEPTEITVGDTFMSMSVVSVEHHEKKINNVWVLEYAEIKFAGEMTLSGDIFYGDPTFFLPNDISKKQLPRIYAVGDGHDGIMFSNFHQLNEILDSNYSNYYNNGSISVSNAKFKNYTLVFRRVGSAENADIICFDGVEVDTV